MSWITIFLALVSLVWCQNEMALRTGIAQLSLGSLSYAAYEIVFSKNLLDNVYNSMVSVSYVTQMALNNGLIINSMCSDTQQTKMGCTITANSDNQNNIVYVSYVASDVGSLVVGTYAHTFYLGSSNSISETLTFQPAFDNNYFNVNSILFINFFPIVCGISSYDSDFSLTIQSLPSNFATIQISLQVTITEFHASTVTVYFGYMMYDQSKITISQYEGQRLVPDSIPYGYIFGISQIFSRDSTSSAPQINKPSRLLQILPESKASTYLTRSIPMIKATVPSSLVYPLIVPRNKTQSSNNTASRISSKLLSSIVVSPAKQSSLAHALRYTPDKVMLIPRKVNYSLFDGLMQPDGVIDANASVLSILQSSGVVPKRSSSLVGINDQQFNTLFGTNGFVILTTADDIDQVYYCEVGPVQNLPNDMPTEPGGSSQSAVYYRSSVTNVQQKPVCSGIIYGSLQKVDYKQSKMILQCANCPSGSYFDIGTRSCVCFMGMVFDRFKNYCGCASGLYFDTTVNRCQCLYGMILNSSTGLCECPQGMQIYSGSDKCSCPSGLEYDSKRKKCKCPNGMVLDQINNFCSCPAYTQFDFATSVCVCGSRMQANPQTGQCQCLSGLEYDKYRNVCDCPKGTQLDLTGRTCGCPPGLFYVSNSYGSSCGCPKGIYLDPIQNICGCPAGMEIDLSRMICSRPLN